MSDKESVVEKLIGGHHVTDFEKELCSLLNKHGYDSFAEVPDYVLARYLVDNISIITSFLIRKTQHEIGSIKKEYLNS